MSTHDYVIDNRSAAAFRADLNAALAAIVTNNSAAVAPTTTFADMLWYDTATNILKKRNEANSAWINLGTINEGAGTFTPTGGTVAIASQAEAEAGTDNTKMMTPLRSAQANTQAIADSTLGAGQTWQVFSGVYRSVNTSYQNTTNKPIQLAIRLWSSAEYQVQASPNNSTWVQVGISQSSSPFTYVVVPVGYYYRVNGNASISYWAELR